MATATSDRNVKSDDGVPEVDVAHFIRVKKELEVDKLFRALVKFEGSDLHLKVGKPPMIRVRNELRPLNRGPIDAEEMVRLLVPMMDERARRIFDEDGGADFAYTVDVEKARQREDEMYVERVKMGDVLPNEHKRYHASPAKASETAALNPEP